MYLPPHIIFDHVMHDECTLDDWAAMACVNREWNVAAMLFKRRVLVGAVIRVFGMGWGESGEALANIEATPLEALVERYAFAMAVLREARVDAMIGIPVTGLAWFLGLDVGANVREAADALCCKGVLGMLRPVGIPDFFARILPDTLIRPKMYYAAVSSLLNGDSVHSPLYDMAAYWPWHRRLEKVWPTLLVLGWTHLALREYDAFLHYDNRVMWGEIVFAFFMRVGPEANLPPTPPILVGDEGVNVVNHSFGIWNNPAMTESAIDLIRQMIDMFDEEPCECQSECRNGESDIVERYHELLRLISA